MAIYEEADIKKLVARTQKEITSCTNCQPFEGGVPIWILGDECELEDLFDELEIPENEALRDSIGNSLVCPRCGTKLQRYDTVGIEEQYIKEIVEQLEVSEKKYGKDLHILNKTLTNYPTLGLQHPIAREILKEIQSDKFCSIPIEGTFYRARKTERAKVFKSQDILPPELGIPGEGRFNHSGQSHFYLSKDASTCLFELSDDDEPFIGYVQEIRIERTDRVLDLTFDFEMVSPTQSALLISLLSTGILRQSMNNKKNWKPDYALTRFIMDCAKFSGYSGIAYNSVKHIGNNIVLFDLSRLKFEPIGEPKLVTFDRDKYWNDII